MSGTLAKLGALMLLAAGLAFGQALAFEVASIHMSAADA